MNGESPAKAGLTGVGTHTKDTPQVTGAVVRLTHPEMVATDLLERMGPVWCLQLAALLVLLAERVTA